MERKEIKYIGFYDLPDSQYKRVSNLAATNKMDYIADAIIEAGYKVHLVSPSWTEDSVQKVYFIKQQTSQLKEHKKITFCPNFTTKRKITRNFKIVFSLLWLFFWLIKNTKKDEKILMYHVQWLSLPVRWAKRFKDFHLVLEVEEFYGKVWETKSILIQWENKLIEKADCYIAVSDVLAAILGSKVKAIVYGSYTLPKIKKRKSYLDKNMINVVYAGSIDGTKKGAYNAVECAALLPDNFTVHILGGGSKKDIVKLNENIKNVNSNKKREACIYHGVKRGEDYYNFLLDCQIALNPQSEGDYMNTAFPSKVISYLSHNLRVISTRINSIEVSSLAHLISFSENDEPENIANAILAINLDCKFDSISEIQKLNEEFVSNIKQLFL